MDSDNRNCLNGPEYFAGGAIVQITLRQLHAFAASPKFWVGLVAVVIVLAVAAPFHTGDSLALPARFSYWLAVALATFFAGLATSVAVAESLRQRAAPPLLATVAGGAVAGIPVTAIVLALNHFAFAFPVGGLAGAAEMLVYCTVITGAVIALHGVLAPPRRQVAAGAPESARRGDVEFLRRLTRPIGRDLVSLQAQDHYVQAKTTQGSELVLLRLADAVRELEGLPGIRVHRSWWVAAGHMHKLDRVGGRPMLSLSDGSRVPVSRDRLAEIRRMLAARA